MLQRLSISPSDMAAKAGAAAALMKALSNEHRLLILCHLFAAGELPVGELVARIGLSQSALSQHLGRLRAEGLVDSRRESQSLFYHVCDPRAGQLLAVLRDIFCPELGGPDSYGDSLIGASTKASEKGAEGE